MYFAQISPHMEDLFLDLVSQIKPGTKMHMAFAAAVGVEPNFNMVCTFHRPVDETLFLVSVPIVEGKPLIPDEKQKFLFKFRQGGEEFILGGYVDDIVKEGIRRYLKIYKVSEERKLYKRADVRLKVALPVEYYDETWPLNEHGTITPEKGETLDISNGGAALYSNRVFDVGTVFTFVLPRIGTARDGIAKLPVVGVICWDREAPKGLGYKYIFGVQFRFSGTEDQQALADYVTFVKEKYKL